jgi:glutamate/tyrosine decarboxylase-like PLP-dependent enzyme
VVGRSVAGSGKATPNFVSPHAGHISLPRSRCRYLRFTGRRVVSAPSGTASSDGAESVDKADHSIQKGASGT